MDKKKMLFIAGGGLLILVIIVASVVRSLSVSAVDVKTARAVNRVYEDKVLTTGKVAALHPGNVYAPFGAQLLSLKVEEGDRVTNGQTLGELDLTSVQSQVDQAKAALAVAAAGLTGQADLAAAQEAVQSAQSAAAAAQTAVKHYQQLYSQGAASQTELAAKQADYTTAQASLKSARQNLSELKNGKAAKVARAQYDQAKTAYEDALKTLGQGHLKAPQSGTVLRISSAEGDYLQPGILIMVVGSADQVQVVADLNEQDIGGVAAGQTVEIQWAGAVGTTFHGSVLRVSPSITASTINPTDNVAHVTIAVDDARGRLKPGATVDSTIYRVKPRQALQVPNEALAGSSGSRYVFVVDGKTASKRAVTVGYSNELFTEIKSGLQENDLVVLSPGSLKDGQPVNPNGGAQK